MTDATPIPGFGSLAPKPSKVRFGAAAALIVMALTAAWFSPGFLAPSLVASSGAAAWTIHPGNRFIESETVIHLPAWPGATLVSVTGSGCFEGVEDSSQEESDTKTEDPEARRFCGATVVGARVAFSTGDQASPTDVPLLAASGNPAELKDIINQHLPIEGTIFDADSALPRQLPSGGQAVLYLLWQVPAEPFGQTPGDDWTEGNDDTWYTGVDTPGADPDPVVDLTLRSVLGAIHTERMTLTGLPAL
jgi:hypothetical protein